ncbi:MAG: HAMP domain-containing sensor histidine kinase [Pirellulales bacterium]
MSLFRRIVAPVVGLVLAAVLANVAFAAWLAARQAAERAEAGQTQVAQALASSRVTLTQPVLDTLQQLTGSHFVIWDPAARAASLTTLSPTALPPGVAASLADAVGDVTVLEGRRYRIGRVRSSGVRPETVLMLVPERSVIGATLEAAWPLVAAAAATLAVFVPLALAALRTPLVASERQRLLGQLAAGFAHELRNAVTGARLAIDLHRRRCDTSRPGATGGDDSLAVAVRQLDIVEAEVRGLLALGRAPQATAEPADLDRLIDDVRELTGARASHAGATLDRGPRAGITMPARRDSLRAALVNLVLNAIDAAGRGGAVRLDVVVEPGAASLVVDDTGPGPPPALAATIHEPFVTGKPEGVGLGLAVAQAVATEHGGTLSWSRHGDRTRFAIRLPLSTLNAAPANSQRP